MRILQAMAGARLGGAETRFERTALAYRAADLEQHLLIRGWTDRVARLRDAGIDVATARFGGGLDMVTPLKAAALLRRTAPDLVVTWMSRASQRVRAGSIVQLGQIGAAYPPKYYRHCDGIIALTPPLAAHMVAAGFAPERVFVVPPFLAAPPDGPTEDRARHGTPDDAPLLLAVGRLHPVKGYDILIDALAGLPAAHLWIAGEGPQRAALEAQIARLGLGPRVRLLGWRAHTTPLYRAADITVVPSRSEGFGNVILEAWAHGVPVVASACDGPASLISDGENGMLVPVGEAHALAAGVRRLIDSPDWRNAVVGAARDTYLQDYTPTRVIERTLEVFATARRLGKRRG